MANTLKFTCGCEDEMAWVPAIRCDRHGVTLASHRAFAFTERPPVVEEAVTMPVPVDPFTPQHPAEHPPL